MNLVQGNLWRELGTSQILLVTGNSFVKKDGALVMGRGAAQQARDKFPGLDKALGTYIRTAGWAYPSRTPYNVVIDSTFDTDTKLGVFQVKWHWADPADLDLIRSSAKGLNIYVLRQTPGRVSMNFPGIGNGRLSREDVLPILTKEMTSDDIYVYEL